MKINFVGQPLRLPSFRHVRILVLVLACAACSTPKYSAEGPAREPDNTTLPKCDRVEVFHLDGEPMMDAKGEDFYSKKRPPPNVKEAYFVAVEGDWTRLLGKKTVKGVEAETIAQLWRRLGPAPPPPPPLRGSVQLHVFHGCHLPGFAYRFYDGRKLLAESTVCWKCYNFGILVGGKDGLNDFDIEAAPAKELLRRSQELFQNRPLKKNRI